MWMGVGIGVGIGMESWSLRERVHSALNPPAFRLQNDGSSDRCDMMTILLLRNISHINNIKYQISSTSYIVIVHHTSYAIHHKSHTHHPPSFNRSSH